MLHNNIFAASGMSCANPCSVGTLSSQCETLCTNGTCKTTTTITNTYGVVTVAVKSISWNCPSSDTGTITCACATESTTYRCGIGYYGTATSSSAGCTACPSGGTCAGGNNSTFICQAGYYKNIVACSNCAVATNHPSATSNSGSTSITACYLPSGTVGSDTTGDFAYTGQCNYSN
jgi:hypothetical protein